MTDFQMPDAPKKQRLGRLKRPSLGRFRRTWRPRKNGSWRLRRRAVAGMRIATLSRKSPTLPHWAVLLLVPIWVAAVGLGVFALLVGPLAAGLPTGAAISLSWLISHHTAVLTPDGAITLLPLGAALVPILLWRRAARWVSVQVAGKPAIVRRTLALAASGYAAITFGVAAITRAGDLRASLILAVVGALVVACVGCWWGLRRAAPGKVRLPNGFAGAATAAAWFVLVGAALLVIAVIANFGEISAARAGVAQSAPEVAAVLLLELAYLPNLIIWAAAYATGAGIALGAGQSVSPYTSSDVVLPDLPILAAVPVTSPAWSAMLPLIMIVGGWLAAVAAQRRAQVVGLGHRFIRVGMLAGMTFVFWFAARVLAGGSLGEGRLDWVGPAAGTGFIAAVLIAAGATVWALMPALASDARPVAVDLRNRVKDRRSKQNA